MDWTAALIVMILILVFGSAVAIGWWNLAAKASPYPDEIERERERRRREAEQEGGEVVVIRREEVGSQDGSSDAGAKKG